MNREFPLISKLKYSKKVKRETGGAVQPVVSRKDRIFRETTGRMICNTWRFKLKML